MMEDKKKNVNFYFFIYVFTLIFFGIFFLYSKHEVGNDSSLSDWLINYSGGFVRRGIIGELSVSISKLFLINLRDSILIIQIIVFSSYYLLVFKFFKNIIFERIFVLAILSPIFILYPVAEIEVLGRKELFVFLIFILYLFSKIENILNQLIFKLILFPLSVLIWEPVIIFFTYVFLIELIIFKIKKTDKKFLLLLLSYSITIFAVFFVYLNPITEQDYLIMKNFLINDFNEKCYMSCSFVGTQSSNSFFELLNNNSNKFKLLYFFRYFFIILFGFLPLIILLKNSKFKSNYQDLLFLSKFKNLFLPFLIIFAPSIILYLLMYDWARIVHISYTFTLLSFFWMIKNNIIAIDFNYSIFSNLNKISKKFFILIFIVFCLGWNPKVVISDDIASKPIYATPYKFYKYFIKAN